MSRQLKDLGEIERDEIALKAPSMTVLSDQALLAQHAHLDSLELAIKLGPVYDIIRHPATVTPMAAAVYGDWGTGKTSAMRWLEGLLHEWNEHGDRGKKDALGKIVRPVWFYPWKYHKKEDVWRGLIAEVILASINIRGATLGRIKAASKRFGIFLGKSFLHALSALKLPGVDAASLQDIYDEYRTAAHPEAGYLNEFESTLSRWIDETITCEGERMVIFIDDLDRCLPEVALQVLEALKLYLNIKDLIFVVGVDRTVIDQLIRKLYADVGLEHDKSRYYLAKMFQVEVSVGPTEKQAEDFLDKQLAALGGHTNQYWIEELVDGDRDIFRNTVLRLAQRNPREIKRLLNSMLINGAGVLRVKSRPLSFAQGVQVFLVRRLLDERYTMGLLVDTRPGMDFFHRWSRLVRAGNPATVDNPEEMAKFFRNQRERRDHGDAVNGGPGHMLQSAGPHPMSIHSGESNPDMAEEARTTPYRELLGEERFYHFIRLLADVDLGGLMQIEYPADTSLLREASRKELPRGLILEAIARQRSKPTTALDEGDFRLVTDLDLDGQEIDDIAPLSHLTELRSLNLSFTGVVDLGPLRPLRKLERLLLGNTPLKDVTPLRDLGQLLSLSLADTPKVADFAPIAGLLALESLNLRGARIRDLGLLAALTRLTSLSLANTKVNDITALAALSALESLSLVNTPVVDITPLARLERLQTLYLSDTQISDLQPLSGLRGLVTLSLVATPVTDLSPLHGLTELRFVDLQACKVPNEQLEALLLALPKLEVRY